MSKRPHSELLASSGNENTSTIQQDSISAPDSPKQPRSKTKKTYECTFPGCGRNYSRAEHLHRHQLNHNPKEIFRCNHPGCERTFVRQDLCTRHQERHLTHGRQGSRVGLDQPDDSGHQDRGQKPRYGRQDSRSAPGSPPSESRESSRSPQPRASNGTSTKLASSKQKSLALGNLDGLQSADSQFLTDDYNPLASHGPGVITFSTPFSGLNSNPPLPPPPPEQLKSRSEQPDLNKASFAGFMPDVASGAASFSIPQFPDQSISESPTSIRDEFASWLFDDFSSVQPNFFHLGGQAAVGMTAVPDNFGTQVYPNYFADPALNNALPDMTARHMSTPGSESSPAYAQDTIISQQRRRRLIDLMEYTFSEGDNEAVRQLKAEILQGNRDSDNHVLSMNSMQLYIGSYWYHFHQQMPILHQPTFSAEEIHEYLLLAVMVLGASFLNRAHGADVTEPASRFANFVAWHLRWQVFMSSDFQPPAKLWVFQTLILLEIFEKANATRALHERAHIHYPTTITLMRRGTALIEDPTREVSRSSRSSTSAQEWWNRWITAEATRRAAFAAFYLDAVHATMFNHAAMMVVHEVQLPLPCDDALWSATSAAEVGRVEASLHANGIKPTTFLDGLKKTLTGRKVRTNNFGRMILMAGLLSVSWHMHQRDLQVSSLGVPHTMGAPGRWRDSLAKSFDFWKKDFDENAAHMRRAALPWQKPETSLDDDNMSRTAALMHHFSHISQQVDTMDSQIFAGTTKLLGRLVTSHDQNRVREKMMEWVKTPGSRVGTYHAIQVLRDVILPCINNPAKMYNARDDHIYQRPWILFQSSLVIWCYGYATDGALRPFPSQLVQSPHPGNSGQHMANAMHTTTDHHLKALMKDANSFFVTVGAVSSPQELETVKSGRNNVIGLILLVELGFRDTRWELLREAGQKLLQAVNIMKGDA